VESEPEVVIEEDVPISEISVAYDGLIIPSGCGAITYHETTLDSPVSENRTGGTYYSEYIKFRLDEEVLLSLSVFEGLGLTYNLDDTYAYLMDSDSNVLDENDDYEDTYFSVIGGTYGPGDYTLEAMAYSDGDYGEFSVSISTLPVANINYHTFLSLGNDKTELTSRVKFDNDAVDSIHEPGTKAKYMTFAIHTTRTITIRTDSDYDFQGEDHGAYLIETCAQDGVLIQEILETSPFSNIHEVTIKLDPGWYTLELTDRGVGFNGRVRVSLIWE